MYLYIYVHGYKYEIQILSARLINRYMLEDSNWEWFSWWTKSGRPMGVFLTFWWPRWHNFFHQQYEMKWWIVRTVRKGKAYATSWFLIIALAGTRFWNGARDSPVCALVFLWWENISVDFQTTKPILPWVRRPSPLALRQIRWRMATLWYWGSDKGYQGWFVFSDPKWGAFGWTPESSKSQG